MERIKILIVEDDAQFRQALYASLIKDFDLEISADAEGAGKILEQHKFDLIIVDLGLPRVDGHRLVASLRALDQHKDTPVIILSGRTELEEKLMGFSLGANDFITKPVDPRELKARILAHTRNSRRQLSADLEYTIGPFQTSMVRQEISYIAGGTRFHISLTPQEFKLLHHFLTHVGHVITREQLLERVWGSARNVSDRSVDALISKTRRKLGPYSNLLESVHGMGYRFLDPPNDLNRRTG